MDFITIDSLYSGHGFGFNTNILETNVINLAVVIAVVVSVVGDAVRELLNTRKETILSNLREADNRATQAQEKRELAVKQLEEAKTKALKIREQGIFAAEQEKKMCISKAEEDYARIIQGKEDIIRLQQQKAVEQISKQIISLAVETVQTKLETKANKPFQIQMNTFKSAFLEQSFLKKTSN